MIRNNTIKKYTMIRNYIDKNYTL